MTQELRVRRGEDAPVTIARVPMVRLGAASRVAAIGPFLGRASEAFYFSPNGRFVSFEDIGPDPHGQDALQMFVLDVETGERTPLTQMPPVGDLSLNAGADDGFVNERALIFDGIFNPDELNPSGQEQVFYLDVLTREIKLSESTIALPGGGLIALPKIIGSARVEFPAIVPGLPGESTGREERV